MSPFEIAIRSNLDHFVTLAASFLNSTYSYAVFTFAASLHCNYDSLLLCASLAAFCSQFFPSKSTILIFPGVASKQLTFTETPSGFDLGV